MAQSKFMNATLEGTFKFCSDCPSNNNCCVRTRHGLGEIANPPLLPNEAAEISAHTGLSVDAFAEGQPGEPLAIKRTDSGCLFYKGGKCEIYAIRPFDCKIFPFDIARLDGLFYWIVYTSLCPSESGFEYDEADFQSAKARLRKSKISKGDLDAFVSHGRDIMAPHPYRRLEVVEL